jgi:alpha-ribazole phosphatase
MMQLWMVRHAQPLIASGVCYGALDVAADRALSQAAATRLAAALPEGVQVQYSPLQRCELLVLLLKGLRADLTYKPEPDLREMDFGHWEGQRWDALDAQALQAWTDDFEHHACGGSGESAGQFVRRVHGVLTRCAGHSTPTVWITHAGVMRAASWLCQSKWAAAWTQPLGPQLGLSASDWPRDVLDFGQMQRLDWPHRPPLGYPAPR